MISLDQRPRARRSPSVPLPAVLAAMAFALALVQRPGQLAADTKIDLHVDPVGFLADVASVWSSTGDLGHVQAGQYAGYLFPMGPFFAVGHVLGLAPWLVHRLWLGAILALAAWGTVRLLDATLDRPRGVAHAVAGAAVLLNPYVVVFADRTSVTLLGYAALPWLLLAMLRATRDPGGWRWPAAFALVLAATGGGVNAAVTGWLLLGPLLLALYQLWRRQVRGRELAVLGGRTALLSLLASAWWIVPVAAHARYGVNFLPFTETVGAIWGTTSMSESLRLLGYWIVYLGTGYGAELEPYMGSAATLLFEPAVVLATLLVPALALAGFAWTRRWSHGPFFLALVLLGLLAMSAGFPEGAPLRRVLTGVYNVVEPVQFLRTTYKAGPLVALGIACLLGAAAGEAWIRWRGAPLLRGLAVAGLAVTLAGAAWPLLQGRAVGAQISFERVPRAWERAGADLDADLPPNSRAIVLPGQLFPFYAWGTPQDPILPALTERPVAVRGVVPFADLHAADLLIAIDSLVQQRRLLPRQLPPLLDLIGARSVIVGADDDNDRSGSVDAHTAALLLSTQPGLAQPDREYGSRRRVDPPPGELGGPGLLPTVRRYDRASRAGVVRVLPRGRPLVVDGSAEALTGLASLGALPSHRVVRYAGDLAAGEIRGALAAGGEIVVTDANRRRTFLSSRHRQSVGAVLAVGDPIPKDAAVLNPFPDRGTAAQTVAVLSGAKSIAAPFSPNFPQFPEHRPYAAFDGDPSTYWVADRYLDDDRRWIEIDFGRERDVLAIRLLAQEETATRVTAVEVAGRRHAVRPGWNRLRTDLRGIRRLRVRISAVSGPADRAQGAGALAEIRIPGMRVVERLRPPVLAQRAVAAATPDPASISYLFQRVTGDDPLRRARRPDPNRASVPSGANAEAPLVAVPGDAETRIRRVVSFPVDQRLRADGWASISPHARDAALARLAARGRARRCGIASVRIGRTAATMRIEGGARALRRGRAVRLRACGAPAGVRAGRRPVTVSPGPLRVDVLRLRSPAGGRRTAVVGGGRVVDPGEEGHGDRDGVRVDVHGPSWLVLGESFDEGWRASCSGRDLGAPTVVSGFANGWPIGRACREASFDYAPNGAARIGYVVSGIGVLGILAGLAIAAVRRRSPRAWSPGATFAARPSPEPAPTSVRRALVAGAAVMPAAALLFSIRASLAIAPVVALALWRGWGAGRLAVTAGVLLAVVLPAIQIAWLPEDRGGFNGRYATDVIAAHWVAVAAWVLLALALWRSLSTARCRRDARAAARADAGGPPAPP